MGISVLITASALLQFLITVAFYVYMRRQKQAPALPSERQDSTWILMSVRGCDPSLKDCIQGLLNQNFRQFQICVVVDHAGDPAMKVLEEIRASFDFEGRLTVRVLQKPLSTCTLKCSALAEGMDYILETDPSADYVAMIDGDLGTNENLLADLIGALSSDDKIGVVSGNQWFEPESVSGFGTIARSMWYAGALFFSILFQNPWAGAFAMRTRTVRQTGLVDVWRNSAVDDGPVKSLMEQHQLACRSIPQLVMINREACTLGFVCRWMTRILTWSKIHEPTFWVTALQMTFSSALILGIFGTLIWAIAIGDLNLVSVSAIAIVVSGILSVLAWTTIRRAVMETSAGVKTFHPVAPFLFLKALFAVAVAQGVYSIACVGAMLSRRVHWRGVNYRVVDRGVQLEEYRPYSAGENHDLSI